MQSHNLHFGQLQAHPLRNGLSFALMHIQNTSQVKKEYRLSQFFVIPETFEQLP